MDSEIYLKHGCLDVIDSFIQLNTFPQLLVSMIHFSFDLFSLASLALSVVYLNVGFSGLNIGINQFQHFYQCIDYIRNFLGLF